MSKHRNYSIEFKRQVAQESLGGETLHQISRTLIRIWLAKLEAGGLDADEVAAEVSGCHQFGALPETAGHQRCSLTIRDPYHRLRNDR